MGTIPERPFLTEDFSKEGGGIDFLGLRYVGLNILGRYLVPELNNVTQDMGTFFLGAWIPWKFTQLCTKANYTEKNYRKFREKIEIAISISMRDDFNASKKYGAVRNRVGITQEVSFPCNLTFGDVNRNENNSIYAAAMYGPAFRAIGMIESYRIAATQPGKSLKIALSSEDNDTIKIVETVNSCLSQSKVFNRINNFEHQRFSREELEELALKGLCPSYYRNSKFNKLHKCFEKKLLPSDPLSPGYGRTLTAKLLLKTLNQHGNLTVGQVRNTWYTGMYEDGTLLTLNDRELVNQHTRWSYLMARQYQRYPLEAFLWCFEATLKDGCCSIDDAVQYWAERSEAAELPLNGNFLNIMRDTAGKFYSKSEFETSNNWNSLVHGKHAKFEYLKVSQSDTTCFESLRMLAGWYWRMFKRIQNAPEELVTLGGPDRMSIKWFMNWIDQRKQFTVIDFLTDLFTELVFSQHTRIAITRFDGSSQRLRFVLGDNGIEPTISAKKDLGNRNIPWMSDRLDMLCALLCDLQVIEMDDNGGVFIKRGLRE